MLDVRSPKEARNSPDQAAVNSSIARTRQAVYAQSDETRRDGSTRMERMKYERSYFSFDL